MRTLLALALLCGAPTAFSQVPLEGGGLFDGETASVQIDLYLGSDDQPLSDFLGIGFVLVFEADVFSDPVLDASTLGDDLLEFEQESSAGRHAFSVSRKGGAAGLSGRVQIGAITLQVDDRSPGLRQMSFEEIQAIDAAGGEIEVEASAVTLAITGIWPGDTDNDCEVAVSDVLPLGANFGLTGAARPGGFEATWSAKECPYPAHWSPFPVVHVDTNGDGVVNQNDLLPIALNFGETHEALPGGCVASDGKVAVVDEVELEVSGKTRVELVVTASLPTTGIAFRIDFDPSALSFRDVRPEGLAQSGLIAFERNDPGSVHAAFVRRAGEIGVSGALAALEFDVLRSGPTAVRFWGHLPEGTRSDLTLRAVSGVGASQAGQMPERFAVTGVFPDPAHHEATFLVDLPRPSALTIELYDLLGRSVLTRRLSHVRSGWGQPLRVGLEGLPSGAYTYRLSAPDANVVLPGGTLMVLR